jgi:hypothetical protein
MRDDRASPQHNSRQRPDLRGGEGARRGGRHPPPVAGARGRLPPAARPSRGLKRPRVRNAKGRRPHGFSSAPPAALSAIALEKVEWKQAARGENFMCVL